MSTLYNLFLSEVKAERGRCLSRPDEVITQSDIEYLPEPVRRYFQICGHIGREKRYFALIDWEDAYLRSSPGGRWRNISCLQFNGIPEPVRIVYMKRKAAGLVAIEGRDKFQDGRGSMLIRIGGMFTVANAKGREMDHSALATVLAECLLIPCYALQPYIEWNAVDKHTAGATLRYKGLTVNGVFHFNEAGEFIRFDTSDRYFSSTGKTYRQKDWSAYAWDYIESGGIRLPYRLAASWQDDKGTFQYFKGRIRTIKNTYTL